MSLYSLRSLPYPSCTSPSLFPLRGLTTLTHGLTSSGNRTDSPLTELIHFSAHTGACFTLSWSSGGLPTSQGGLGLLASGGADGRIIIWQLVDTKHQSTIDPEAPPAKSPLSSINGKDTGVQVYPVAAVRNAHGVADVNAVNWCLREDGKGQGMLASAGDDGTVKVWRVVA